MNHLLAAAFVLASFTLSGCWTPPERRDPFATLAPATSPYRDLTVAVVLSDNTKRSLDYTNRTVSSKGIAPRFDPNPVFERISAIFTRDFKKAVRVEKLSEAKAAGADVAVVLDIYVNLTMSDVLIDAGAGLTDLEGKPLESIKGHGEQSMFAHFTLTIQKTVDEATDRTVESLESALLKSEKLQALAKARGGVVETSAATSGTDLPPSPSPSFSETERLDDLAVIVGIESYSDIASKAPFAERDADAFKAHVRALGVPERNIVLLKGSKAGRASLVKNLEQWLPRMAKADSRVYFYFSGHGAPDVKTGQAYLVPWDGDPNFLESTAYPVAQLYRKLGELPAKQVLVAMDSCFSGAGGRSVLASGARPLVSKVETGAVPAKITVLAASASNEISGSLDDKGHGAFTYFLLQGLDAGKTTPKSLVDYLTPRVQDEARRLNRDQTPQLQGDGSWSLR